jgi:hypothetical protein
LLQDKENKGKSLHFWDIATRMLGNKNSYPESQTENLD